jgi:hypothetical protein
MPASAGTLSRTGRDEGFHAFKTIHCRDDNASVRESAA